MGLPGEAGSGVGKRIPGSGSTCEGVRGDGAAELSRNRMRTLRSPEGFFLKQIGSQLLSIRVKADECL